MSSKFVDDVAYEAWLAVFDAGLIAPGPALGSWNSLKNPDGVPEGT